MTDAIVSYYENYMPGPDVLVIALGLIFFILTRTSYINLQGYKYSKPIPIEQLSEYFSKEQP
ncbi:MAG: hypothetical protein K5654_03040 [Lachnospiraceae bacterium]|jgi:hypothetical protein|nr:hypothetical protein [Lachnospiraceae bacterium]